MLHKLKEGKSPVATAQIDALANLYNDLIETVARCEFRKAFHLATMLTSSLVATPAGKCRIDISDEEYAKMEQLEDFGFDDDEF